MISGNSELIWKNTSHYKETSAVGHISKYSLVGTEDGSNKQLWKVGFRCHCSAHFYHHRSQPTHRQQHCPVLITFVFSSVRLYKCSCIYKTFQGMKWYNILFKVFLQKKFFFCKKISFMIDFCVKNSILILQLKRFSAEVSVSSYIGMQGH